MFNKIIKYSKVLIALTLIASLTIPSYATVGASDGSAFVTKAEFDAALSDFNARLTTFEAGINSKIDSQVSSYLDRNGIWQGKEQSLAQEVWKFNFMQMLNIPETNRYVMPSRPNGPPAKSGSATSGGWTTKTWSDLQINCRGIGFEDDTYSAYQTWRPSDNVVAWFAEYWLAKNTGSTSTHCFDQVIFVANKSGLVFAPLEQTADYDKVNQITYSTNQNFFADHVDTFDLGYSITVEDKVVVRKSLFSTTFTGSDYFEPAPVEGKYRGRTVSPYDAGSISKNVPISLYSATEQFFVSKGDTVRLCAAPIIHDGHAGKPASWCVNTVLKTGSNTDDDWDRHWEFSFPRGISIY